MSFPAVVFSPLLDLDMVMGSSSCDLSPHWHSHLSVQLSHHLLCQVETFRRHFVDHVYYSCPGILHPASHSRPTSLYLPPSDPYILFSPSFPASPYSVSAYTPVKPPYSSPHPRTGHP